MANAYGTRGEMSTISGLNPAYPEPPCILSHGGGSSTARDLHEDRNSGRGARERGEEGREWREIDCGMQR